MTLAHYDLVHSPRLAAVACDELPLFDPAIDVYVVALLERRGDIGKLSVKTEAVPVRVFPCFPAAIRMIDYLLSASSLPCACLRGCPSICLTAPFPCE